jgi:hypothetical protein
MEIESSVCSSKLEKKLHERNILVRRKSRVVNPIILFFKFLVLLFRSSEPDDQLVICD